MTNYWQERQKQRINRIERRSNKVLAVEFDIYRQAYKNIIQDIQKLIDKYAVNGVIDKTVLKENASKIEDALMLGEIRKTLDELGYKDYNERFLYRLSRLEAIKAQIGLEMLRVAPKEEKLDDGLFSEILKEQYKEHIQDLGFRPTFQKLNKRVTEAILNSRWAGGNYSTRIWGNAGDMAERLQVIVGSGITAGQSIERIGKRLREAFDVKRYEAVRLARTESMYFNHQAFLQCCIDNGVTKYRIETILDERTSDICRSINTSEEHYIEDIIVGVNYPPFHPSCRSLPVMVLEDFAERLKKLDERVERFEDNEVTESEKDNARQAAMERALEMAKRARERGEVKEGSLQSLIRRKENPIMQKLQDMEGHKIPLDKKFLEEILKGNDEAMKDRARHVLRYLNT